LLTFDMGYISRGLENIEKGEHYDVFVPVIW